MKKKLALFAVVILVVMLAGCGKSSFGVVINEDLNVEITAENAVVKSTGMAGTFTVEKDDAAVIEPNLEKGTIIVQFFTSEQAENMDVKPEELLEQGDPALMVEVSGTDPIECPLSAGDYMVNATVTEKASGTVIIKPEAEDSAGNAAGSEAAITLHISTDGMGQIAYAEEGNTPEFSDDQPFQSTFVNSQDPATYVLGAKADEGWKFVKWTKDGADFSQDEQITVTVDSSVEYCAVFEADE